MNISSLLEKIDLYREMVEQSGFARDIDAYVTALSQPDTQSNLVALKNIASDLENKLRNIEESDLPPELNNLFPKRKSFTDTDHTTALRDILNDPNIKPPDFFSRLNAIVNTLKSQIDQDTQAVNQLEKVFRHYAKQELSFSEIEKAIISIIFRDAESIKSLKSFSRALDRWNRTLYLYHQLVSSESPQDFGLIEIQNGSIDVVVDLKVDVALDLIEVFKIALYAFGMYLTYKAQLHKIIPTYLQNRQLIEMEAEREKIMLGEIKNQVRAKLLEQHSLRKDEDSEISDEGLDSKVDQISSHVSDQIVRGNEIKLLAAPKPSSESDQAEIDVKEKNRELRAKSKEIRNLVKEIGTENITQLLKEYKQEINESDKPEGKGRKDKPEKL